MEFGFWAITDLPPPEDMANAERVLSWHRATDFLIGKRADGSDDPDGASHDVRTFMDFTAPGATRSRVPSCGVGAPCADSLSSSVSDCPSTCG